MPDFPTSDLNGQAGLDDPDTRGATENLVRHLVQKFKLQVHDQAKEVDPTDEQDWFSITLGWALANGLTPKEAHVFATHIRYETDLG
jgi:hypothetical protein